MNYATLILNDDYKYASKINKYIHKNKGRSIAIILGNYELNGCPLFNNKDTRINKLIKIGYDLILEIPSLVYLSDINNLSDYIINLIKKLDIVKLYLPSEFYSLKSFKEFLLI